jgi:hypothetical protein
MQIQDVNGVLNAMAQNIIALVALCVLMLALVLIPVIKTNAVQLAIIHGEDGLIMFVMIIV